MNVKQIINFKMIREKGPAAFEVKDNEVIQLVTVGKEIKCLVTQEYLLTLEADRESLLSSRGVELKRTPHDPAKIKSKFKAKLEKLSRVIEEDKMEASRPQLNHEAQANQLLDLLLADKTEEFNQHLAEYLEQVKEARIQELTSKKIKVPKKK